MTEPVDALVVGSSGQVGGALVELLGPGGCLGTWRKFPIAGGTYFSLTDVLGDPRGVRTWLAALSPKWVFITAAMSQVDSCETNAALAGAINTQAPGALAALNHSLGGRTVYFSTEYVFDGLSGPYAEEDPPRPLSVYGKTKLAGEWAVLDADPDALVVRTTVVYGPEHQGKNFAYQLARALQAGRRLAVADDQVSTPTYNRDLALMTRALTDKEAQGVWHVAGTERMSRVDFARRLARAGGLDESLIDAVPTSRLGQGASRPLDAGLHSRKATTFLSGHRSLPVESAVAEWVRRPRGASWPYPSVEIVTSTEVR